MRGSWRDVPWFVWLVGAVGVVAVALGYAMALDSKPGDALRELGWLGVGVLVTVVGIEEAQRRARAQRWRPVVDTLRIDARRAVARLVGRTWSGFDFSNEAVALWVTSSLVEPDDDSGAKLEAASTWLRAHWSDLLSLRDGVMASGEHPARHVIVPRPAMVEEIGEVARDLLATVQRLIELTDDAALASRRESLGTSLDWLFGRLPAIAGDHLWVGKRMADDERAGVAERLDEIVSAVLAAADVADEARALDQALRA